MRYFLVFCDDSGELLWLAGRTNGERGHLFVWVPNVSAWLRNRGLEYDYYIDHELAWRKVDAQEARRLLPTCPEIPQELVEHFRREGVEQRALDEVLPARTVSPRGSAGSRRAKTDPPGSVSR